MIVTVASLKGGSGKTTTASYLAAGLHARGRGVRMVDADPQGSALGWGEWAEVPWPTVALPTKTIHRRVAQLGVAGEDLVIDTPPGDLGIIASALRAAAVAVLPVKPTAADMSQVAETQALVEDAAAATDLETLIVLTMAVHGTVALRETRASLAGAGLAVAKTVIHQRQMYALAWGTPILDLGEYAGLLDEVEEIGR